MELSHSKIQKAFDWLVLENGENFLASDEHCATRDVFQARLEKMNAVLKDKNEFREITSLIVVIAGEIGNNAFDHNLGNWRDVTGIYYAYDILARCVIIADRGLGIQSTLKRVRPDIQNDCQALTMAFKEIVTSRAPEKRGNGLKLVEKMVLVLGVKLETYSGYGCYRIEDGQTGCLLEEKKYDGVIAVLKF